MRDVPFDQNSAATTLARAFILTLKNGETFGFTNCDQPLIVDGISCRPMQGAESEARSGFDPDSGALRAVFDLDLSKEDILGGFLDGALLDEWRVDWADMDKALHVTRGRLGAIQVEGDGFEVEWLGQSTLLDRSTGRVFSRLCDAEYGDARCGLSAEDGQSCARTFTACQAFGNEVNFRGFPYIVGDDVLQAGVHLTPTRNGGSRYA
jgi:hypothetical protein